MNIDETLSSALMALERKMGIKSHLDMNSCIHQLKGGGQSLVYKVILPEGATFCLKLKRRNVTKIHLKRESIFLPILNAKYFPKLILVAINGEYLIEEWIEGTHLNIHNRQLFLRNLKTIIHNLHAILQLLGSTEPAILHRDIKPDNLRFRNNHLILLDFGSAEYEGKREVSVPKSFAKLGARTHLFQPFEQLTSHPSQDRRVDVFAAASLIYAILFGHPPYENIQSGYDEALGHYKQKEIEVRHNLMQYSDFGLEIFNALRVEPQVRSFNFDGIIFAENNLFLNGTT